MTPDIPRAKLNNFSITPEGFWNKIGICYQQCLQKRGYPGMSIRFRRISSFWIVQRDFVWEMRLYASWGSMVEGNEMGGGYETVTDWEERKICNGALLWDESSRIRVYLNINIWILGVIYLIVLLVKDYFVVNGKSEKESVKLWYYSVLSRVM